MIEENILIRRVFDEKEVYKVFRDDNIYRYISDDFSPHAEDFTVTSLLDSDSVYFIGVYVNNQIAGMFFYHPHNHILFEVHSAIIKKFRGRMSPVMAGGSLKWMIENTECKKVITNVPSGNAPALSLAKNVGFIVEGVNRKSIMLNNKLLDQTVLGITSEEISCQQYQQ